jgi:hypothetical protein
MFILLRSPIIRILSGVIIDLDCWWKTRHMGNFIYDYIDELINRTLFFSENIIIQTIMSKKAIIEVFYY